MTKMAKKYAHLTADETMAEVTRLRREIAKARVDLVAERAKNTRTVFNLRHQLAAVLSYASHRR